MIRVVGIILLLITGTQVQGQTNWPMSVNNNPSVEQGFLGSVSNPAIFGDERLSAGLLYLNRALSSTINAGGFGVNLKQKHSNIGLSAWRQGTENLNRQKVQLNLGQEISEKFALGVSVGMQRLTQSQNYGNLNQLNGAVFATLKPVKEFSASAYWLGIAKYGTEDADQEAGLAVNYNASKSVIVSGLLKSSPNWDPSLGLSIAYSYKEKVRAQLTATDSPEPLLLSLMLTQSEWSPFIQIRQHNDLGLGFSIGVQWSK